MPPPLQQHQTGDKCSSVSKDRPSQPGNPRTWSCQGEPGSGSVKGGQHENVPSSVIVWSGSWLEGKQRRLELWSQDQLNLGTSEGTRRHSAVLFSSAAAEEPSATALTGCSEEPARHLHQRAPIFLRERRWKRGSGVHLQASFKKTVSTTSQEHMLDIIFSSEYKSSCVLRRPSQRLVTLS